MEAKPLDEEDIYLASDKGKGPQVTDRVDEEDHNLLDYEPVDAQEYIEDEEAKKLLASEGEGESNITNSSKTNKLAIFEGQTEDSTQPDSTDTCPGLFDLLKAKADRESQGQNNPTHVVVETHNPNVAVEDSSHADPQGDLDEASSRGNSLTEQGIFTQTAHNSISDSDSDNAAGQDVKESDVSTEELPISQDESPDQGKTEPSPASVSATPTRQRSPHRHSL